MKKVCTILIFVFSISILLFGCSKEKEDMTEDFGLEKTKKIEVSSVENPELVFNVIDNKDDIDEFVNKLNVNKWSIVDIPSNITKGNIYKMYQEDTVKLGESNTEELKQIATIITYKDSPYISFKTKKLNFSFKVPKDVAKYLSNNDN